MMKRLLLYSIFVFLLIAGGEAKSQCVPNTSITTSGITPDSATGLSPAQQGLPYSQVMQIRVPADTVVLGIPAPIVSSQLTTFSGLPPGLSYNCTPSNCTFPGGTNGCVLISGTPTVSGHFQLTAIVKTMVTVIVTTVTQYDTIGYYYIDVTAPTGLAQNNGKKAFFIEQNSPNPFNDFTSISFWTPASSTVELKVFNMIGKEVYHKQQNTDSGKNNIRLDGRDFSPGVYMYTLSNGKETLTKRMVISRK